MFSIRVRRSDAPDEPESSRLIIEPTNRGPELPEREWYEMDRDGNLMMIVHKAFIHGVAPPPSSGYVG